MKNENRAELRKDCVENEKHIRNNCKGSKARTCPRIECQDDK